MRRFLKSQKDRFSLRQSKSGTRSASKDFSALSMPLTNQGWPEEFGFRLGGNGPSYILSVEEGSSANAAGLQAGDQVLEIEGQDVSALNPQALAVLAQKQKNVPPSIGVVSRIQQLDIPPGPDGRFGFTIVGDCPLLVEDCQRSSPAGRCGLRAGDLVLEVNGIQAKQHETAAAVIKASQGRTLRLGVLRLSRRFRRSGGGGGGGSLKEPAVGQSGGLKEPAGQSGGFKELAGQSGGLKSGQRGSVKGPRQEGPLSSPEGGQIPGGMQGGPQGGRQEGQPGSIQGGMQGELQGGLQRDQLRSMQGGLQGCHPSGLQRDHQPSSLQGGPQGGPQGQQSDLQGRVGPQSSDIVRQDRRDKAVEFNKKIEQVLGREPEVKEKLFAALRQYANERQVDILASALPGILTTEEHRQLLEAIRVFIPRRHRDRFDEVVSQSLVGRIRRGKSLSELGQSRLQRSRSEAHPQRLLVSTRASSVPRSAMESSSSALPPTRGLRKTTSLIAGHSSSFAPAHSGYRTVRVHKGNKSFGFTLRGHAPVWIDSVIPGSPADKAGLKPGDRILFLNGLDMRTCSHEKVVSMLQGSGAMPTLLVEDGLTGFPPSGAEPPREGRGSPPPARPSPVLTSLQWVAEILPPSIRVDGLSFAQQLEHLLTHSERYAFCKALQAFFQHRNLDTLIVDVFLLLDTPAKQVIWQFIYQLLTYEEQEHCQNKISRFLGYRAAAAAEPDPAPEPQRRSSSMRVIGTTQRSSVRGRSSDDCIIGTHLGKGIHQEPAEVGMGMRLTPGERQSGDGTSLPETPNLTNLSAVYAELESVYSGKRTKSKSLKIRRSPTPDPHPTLEDLEPDDLIHPTPMRTAGSRISGPPMSWEENLPDSQYQGYSQDGEPNPYLGLDSPPPSPSPPPLDYPPSPSSRRRKRFTFSHCPQSVDTSKFLDALNEQLGLHIASVDDFLSPDNDYEEMSFQDEDEDDEAVFLSRDLSSPSECHSSSGGGDGGGDGSSLTYSSSSEHIPPHPQSPPPPPPFMFNDPPLPPPSAAPPPEPKPALPRMHPTYQRRHPHQVPPPPPPRRSSIPHRQSLHKAPPPKEELLSNHPHQSLPALPVTSAMTAQEGQQGHRAHRSLPARPFPEPASPGRPLQELPPQGGLHRRPLSPEPSDPQPNVDQAQRTQEMYHVEHARQMYQAQQAQQAQQMYLVQQAQQMYQAHQIQQAQEAQQIQQTQQVPQRHQSSGPVRQSLLQQMHQAHQAQRTQQVHQAQVAQQIRQAQQAAQSQQIQSVHSTPQTQQPHSSLQPTRLRRPSLEHTLQDHPLQLIHQTQQTQQIQQAQETQSLQTQPVHPTPQTQQPHSSLQPTRLRRPSLEHTLQDHPLQLIHQAQQAQQIHQAQQTLSQQTEPIHPTPQTLQRHSSPDPTRQRRPSLEHTLQDHTFQQLHQAQQTLSQQTEPIRSTPQTLRHSSPDPTRQRRPSLEHTLQDHTLQQLHQAQQTQSLQTQPVHPTPQTQQPHSSLQPTRLRRPSLEHTLQDHPLQLIHQAQQTQQIHQAQQTLSQQTEPIRPTTQTLQRHASPDPTRQRRPSLEHTLQDHTLQQLHQAQQTLSQQTEPIRPTPQTLCHSSPDPTRQRRPSLEHTLQDHTLQQLHQAQQTQFLQTQPVHPTPQTQQPHSSLQPTRLRRPSLEHTLQDHTLQQLHQAQQTQQIHQAQQTLSQQTETIRPTTQTLQRHSSPDPTRQRRPSLEHTLQDHTLQQLHQAQQTLSQQTEPIRPTPQTLQRHSSPDPTRQRRPSLEHTLQDHTLQQLHQAQQTLSQQTDPIRLTPQTFRHSSPDPTRQRRPSQEHTLQDHTLQQLHQAQQTVSQQTEPIRPTPQTLRHSSPDPTRQRRPSQEHTLQDHTLQQLHQAQQTQSQQTQPVHPSPQTHQRHASPEPTCQRRPSPEPTQKHHPSPEPTPQDRPLQKTRQSRQKQKSPHPQQTKPTDQAHQRHPSPEPPSKSPSLQQMHQAQKSHNALQAQLKQQAQQIHQALLARQAVQSKQTQPAQETHQTDDGTIPPQQDPKRHQSPKPPLQKKHKTPKTPESHQAEPPRSAFTSCQARPSDPSPSESANPPPPPPLPPPCEPPPLPGPNHGDSNHMNVKRLRWEQVENSEGTIWGQLGEDSEYDKLSDMVKYLDLEHHFGTQKSALSVPETAGMPQPDTSKKKGVVAILSHKKAYNTSILIAHLKLSPAELRQALMSMSADRLEPAHLKQLLLYSPDEDEVKQYSQPDLEPHKLSEPDQFVLQMMSVPQYKTRLRSLLYKTTLQEKLEEMKAGYDCIFNASLELQTSKKLAKILEFVLAMGNYLNNGPPKANKTTGFKINFLTELGTTKTVDGKSTFLHILVKSLSHHFPEVLGFAKELTTVSQAAKVNPKTITTDLNDLQDTVREIRTACQTVPATPEDRFAAVMSGFLENTHPAVQSLESLQQRAMREFGRAASFFGEDTAATTTESFFGIFTEFITKFERALHEIQAPEIPRSPRSPRLPSASPLPW